MRTLCLIVTIISTYLSIPTQAQGQEWFEPAFRERAQRPPPRRYQPWQPPTQTSASPAYREPRYYAPQPLAKVREPLPMTVAIDGNIIIVFRKSQQYAAFIDGRAAYLGDMPLRGPVSTGIPGRYETPLTDVRKGAHSISQDPRFKKIDYVSGSWPKRPPPEKSGGAPMPYAMFFDLPNGIALHEGTIPSWGADSHGCVRLLHAHAKALFEHFSDESVRVIVVEDVADLAQWERPPVVVYRQ